MSPIAAIYPSSPLHATDPNVIRSPRKKHARYHAVWAKAEVVALNTKAIEEESAERAA